MSRRSPAVGQRARRAGGARRAAAGSASTAEGQVSLTVRALAGAEARHLQLRLLSGRAGLTNQILLSRVQRPGLALNGYTDYIRYGRVQIVGKSEIGYLAGLTPGRRTQVLRALTSCRISCFVVTRGLDPPRELLRAADARAIPLFGTRLDSTALIKRLSVFLEERLAPHVELHAVLTDVFGLGVLITGESGIGKSECALDLIDRGHRLVSDDVTLVRRVGDTLVGSSPDLTRDHMELRGLGVINIKDLYGVSSIRASKRIQLVVSLERWEVGRDYDRLGLTAECHEILGTELPLVRMPVAPGRSISLLVEIASRLQLLKERGYDAARLLAERVDELAAEAVAGEDTRYRGMSR
jgi:HPr kinase/phosphorylase